MLDAQDRGAIQIANAEYAVDKALEDKNENLVLYMNGQISFDEYQQAVRDWEIEQLNLELVKINVDNSISEAAKNAIPIDLRPH